MSTYLFGTVRDPDIRATLRADYAELKAVLKVNAPKSAVVLSGAILEGLLLDYLLTIGYTRPSTKRSDLREMGLGELVDAAASDEVGALSRSTRELCGVLQEYRNLVHPGRIARNRERPTVERAQLAAQAVDLVHEELSAKALQREEWDAEALVDGSDFESAREPVIHRCVKGLSDDGIRRLLVSIIPERVEGWIWDIALAGEPDHALRRYRVAYRAAWVRAGEDVRRQAALALLEVVHGDSSSVPFVAPDMVDALFWPELLDYLDEDDREALLGEALGQVGSLAKKPESQQLVGMGRHLDTDQVVDFAKQLANVAFAKSQDETTRSYARKTLANEFGSMDQACRSTLIRWIDDAISEFSSKGHSALADQVAGFRFELEPLSEDEIPR